MNRRQLVQLAALAGMTPAAFATRHSSSPELAGQALLDAYVRLAGSFDDRLIIWWMDGKQLAVINGKAEALFGMKVGMFHRFFRQADGTFKIAFFELTYFTDLNTGALLTEYENPYTGRTDKVRHVRLGPEVRLLNTSGLSTPDNPMVQNYRSSLGPATISNGMVWLPTSVEALIKFPKPTAPEIALSIYTTVNGHLDAALDTSLVSAHCSFSFSNAQRYVPWMRMGDLPGHMMGVAAGRKMEQVDELPDDYLACAEAVHPKYIADPVAALARQTSKILGS